MRDGSAFAPKALMDIANVNALSREDFLARFGEVFEHSPWVAERAFAEWPFRSVDHLHDAMVGAARGAAEPELLALLRAHPELGGPEAKAKRMTAASTGEQGRLGIDVLPAHEARELEELNRRYRERFGFPCIIALRKHATRDSVYAEHRRRLERDREQEIAACLDEIAAITRGRLDALVSDAGGDAA